MPSSYSLDNNKLKCWNKSRTFKNYLMLTFYQRSLLYHSLLMLALIALALIAELIVVNAFYYLIILMLPLLYTAFAMWHYINYDFNFAILLLFPLFALIGIAACIIGVRDWLFIDLITAPWRYIMVFEAPITSVLFIFLMKKVYLNEYGSNIYPEYENEQYKHKASH